MPAPSRARPREQHNNRPGSSQMMGLLAGAKSSEALLSIFSAHSACMDHIHISRLWNLLAKHLRALGERSGRDRASWLARHRAPIAALLDATEPALRKCNAQGLANIASGLAHCGEATTVSAELVRVYSALAEVSVAKIDGFGPQALANTAWAFAKARQKGWPAEHLATPANALFAAIARAAGPQLASFNALDLANTAWAFARGAPRQIHRPLLDALSARAASTLGDFSAQALANTVWAYHFAKVSAPSLLGGALREALRVLEPPPRAGRAASRAFKTSELVMLVSSSTGEISSADADADAPRGGGAGDALRTRFFTAAAPRLAAAASSLDCGELCHVTVAYADARVVHRPLLEKLAAAAVARLRDFSSAQAACVLYAHAQLGMGGCHAELYARAAIELAPRVGALPRYVLAPIVWAYAVADARHVDFLRACARRAEVIFDGRGGAPAEEEGEEGADADEIAALHRLSAGVGAESAESGADGRAAGGESSLRKMHQWQLWCEHELRESSLLLPSPVRARLRRAFASVSVRPSRFQREVSAVLGTLGHGAEMEEEHVEEGGHSIDIALPRRRLAIEADGPHHFVHVAADDGAPQPSGKTALKRRLLRALGWRLVPVPFTEWEVRVGAGERATYLDRMMRAALDGAGAPSDAPPPRDAAAPSKPREVDVVEVFGVAGVLCRERGPAPREDGAPPPAHAAAAGASHLVQGPSEADSAYAARLRYARDKFGPGPPASGADAARQQALSMVWANRRYLGCVYSAEVEAAAQVREAAAEEVEVFGVAGVLCRQRGPAPRENDVPPAEAPAPAAPAAVEAAPAEAAAQPAWRMRAAQLLRSPSSSSQPPAPRDAQAAPTSSERHASADVSLLAHFNRVQRHARQRAEDEGDRGRHDARRTRQRLL